jgi:hypothetical protein
VVAFINMLNVNKNKTVLEKQMLTVCGPGRRRGTWHWHSTMAQLIQKSPPTFGII